MLFAISGSQGSGKSTVLNELTSKGFEVLTRKISRSILADWDISLDEVNKDPNISLAFQDEILTRKHADELEACMSDDIVFTERTYMDSWTYYMYTFGSKTEFSSHINDYYDRCVEYDAKYAGVFLLPFGQFDIQADGVRNGNSLYAESVDIVLRSFLRKTMPNTLHELTAESVNGRLAQVLSKVVKYNTN